MELTPEERESLINRKLQARAAYVRTPEGRRELAIDTMASWRLEGLEPTPEALERIRDYVEGRVSIEECIDAVKAWAAARAHPENGTPSTG
ncbi:antitoxin VbhA family protein [Leifsonia sp. H3M29-4]|uniref:antitoxin VbhA family protein n=1 Tax=Salinibacterium metalliresistens TaxID=3031321 RepID=UPI0023D9832E|nr:antitoxin VbhA family protein [Salinibacterium metalliresistens]MDF1477745.1 antitoxin VbhA family protein [Salinibacterium metalliresistens]